MIRVGQFRDYIAFKRALPLVKKVLEELVGKGQLVIGIDPDKR